jgi:hypothetical protein
VTYGKKKIGRNLRALIITQNLLIPDKLSLLIHLESFISHIRYYSQAHHACAEHGISWAHALCATVISCVDNSYPLDLLIFEDYTCINLSEQLKVRQLSDSPNNKTTNQYVE